MPDPLRDAIADALDDTRTPPLRETASERIDRVEAAVQPFIAEAEQRALRPHSHLVGNGQHPDTLAYMAVNLREAMKLVPDTGDWHGQVRAWCHLHAGERIVPNKMAEGQIAEAEARGRATGAKAERERITSELGDYGGPLYLLEGGSQGGRPDPVAAAKALRAFIAALPVTDPETTP